MSLDYLSLKGKVAVIAGGATGIGLGITEGLADAGATIVICSRRIEVCEEAAKEINKKTGAEVVPMRCDITSTEEVEKLVKDVVEKFGGIDILYNSAGIGGSEKPILKMEEADWDRVLDINLKGAFIVSKAVAESMKERGKGGKIVNVASIGGTITFPNMSAYCASKGGMVQLTKVMALEWARYDIQVNVIQPGYFETPMNTEFFSSDVGKAIINKNVPQKRLGNINEIKGLAVLLASDASSFMTGAAVIIDGGYTIW
ncbi:SDR family NAD(P)-dependent oxidoreductase [Spirochaetota bacterium]